jgi:hypothetical protein
MNKLIVLIAVLFIGCSAEKKTANTIKKGIADQAAFNAIGKYYIEKYGCISDTTSIVYLPGQDIIKYNTLYDTIPYKVPCDSFTAVSSGGIKVVVDGNGGLSIKNDSIPYTVRVDTTIYGIVDKTQIVILYDSLLYYRTKSGIVGGQLSDYKKESQQKDIKISVLLVLLGIITFFLMKK